MGMSWYRSPGHSRVHGMKDYNLPSWPLRPSPPQRADDDPPGLPVKRTRKTLVGHLRLNQVAAGWGASDAA
jgi:hypothetical protein